MAVPLSSQQTMEDASVKENAGVTITSDGVGNGAPNDDGSALDDSASKAKSARDAVTPLAHMPYTEQLEHKKNSIMQMLKKLVRNTSLLFLLSLFALSIFVRLTVINYLAD